MIAGGRLDQIIRHAWGVYLIGRLTRVRPVLSITLLAWRFPIRWFGTGDKKVRDVRQYRETEDTHPADNGKATKSVSHGLRRPISLSPSPGNTKRTHAFSSSEHQTGGRVFRHAVGTLG